MYDWFLRIQNTKQDLIYVDKYPNRWEVYLGKNTDWKIISKYQKLSEPFIEKRKEKIDWILISIYQKLSESFIEKHSDKLNSWAISRYQNVSKKFKSKNLGYA